MKIANKVNSQKHKRLWNSLERFLQDWKIGYALFAILMLVSFLLVQWRYWKRTELPRRVWTLKSKHIFMIFFYLTAMNMFLFFYFLLVAQKSITFQYTSTGTWNSSLHVQQMYLIFYTMIQLSHRTITIIKNIRYSIDESPILNSIVSHAKVLRSSHFIRPGDPPKPNIQISLNKCG